MPPSFTPPPDPIPWVAFDLRNPSHRCVVRAQTWMQARTDGAAELRLGGSRERVWAVVPHEGETVGQAIARALESRGAA